MPLVCDLDWPDEAALCYGQKNPDLLKAYCLKQAVSTALTATSVTFVSQAAFKDGGIVERLGAGEAGGAFQKDFVAIENVRGGISKADMVMNDATPDITVDPETYEVRADGELLVCDPAEELPMAQRYFLF